MRIFILNNWNEFMKFWDGDKQHQLTEIEFYCSRTTRDPILQEQPWQNLRNWEEPNCYHTQHTALILHLQITTMVHFLRGRNFENIEVRKWVSPNSSHQKPESGTVAEGWLTTIDLMVSNLKSSFNFLSENIPNKIMFKKHNLLDSICILFLLRKHCFQWPKICYIPAKTLLVKIGWLSRWNCLPGNLE